MRKFTQGLAVAVLLVGSLPLAASAHEGNDNNNGGDRGGIHAFANVVGMFHRMHGMRPISGNVTAVSSTGFTFTATDGKVYTVTTADAKIMRPFSTTALTLADIHVGDKVSVKGTLTDTTIAATSVLDMAANTHPAVGKGTVTAVNGNALTVQMNSHGIVSNVTVNTDANTTVTKSDNSAGTLSDILVGAKVKVAGMWNELTNALLALKIKIK